MEGGGRGAPRLFEIPGAHPYVRCELLTKLFNHVTARSNIFAVWLTVGFFEVTDASTRPVKLGREVGRAENRHVRHRMFAIVDRTKLALFTTRAQSDISIPPGQTKAQVTVTLDRTAGVGGNGQPWAIQVSSTLMVDEEVNEEAVTVTAVAPRTFTATFTRPHARGFTVTAWGNPGPWPRFHPAAHPDVVPYFSVVNG